MEYELFLDRFDLMTSSSPGQRFDVLVLDRLDLMTSSSPTETEDPEGSPLRLLKAASMLMTCLDGVTVMPACSKEEMPDCICR